MNVTAIERSATKYRFAALEIIWELLVLNPAKRYFVASALNSRDIHVMVLHAPAHKPTIGATPMDEIWTRLEAFLQQNAPPIYAGLALGATEAEISETEETCGFPFPADVRQSYLRHNGQLLDEQWAFAGGTFVPCGCGLFPLFDVLDRWQGMADGAKSMETMGVMPFAEGASPGVQPVFVSQKWLPFATDISGNYLCLDFDPAPGGRVGQIVEFNHEAEGQLCLAPSFRVWLEMIVSDLETGRLVWNVELEGYEYPEEETDKTE